MHKSSAQMLIMSEEGEKQCDFCPLKFSNDGHLKTHMMISHSEERKVRQVCDSVSNKKGKLQEHIIQTHTDKENDTDDNVSIDKAPEIGQNNMSEGIMDDIVEDIFFF